jgi:ATP-dependent helicase HrpB
MLFPIDKVLPELFAALAGSPAAVLSAPPAAGKTVRVPLAVLACDWLQGKKIIMLEPRKLAARRAAEFMAQQLKERVGQTAGYRIRGDSVVSNQTRIEVVTEGILTRMLHAHPDLPGVGLVIFDEFHERSIHADLGLALTWDAQKHLRNDLRLLIMSATLNGLAVARLLDNAPVINAADTAFPIATRYSHFSAEKPLAMRLADMVHRALAVDEGDILVFVPGMAEIRQVEENLSNRRLDDVLLCILHGDLPARVQETALAPAPRGKRKVILSTSIAETSLTIDGVRIVIDCGLTRTARFDPRRGMSGLVTMPVSRAVADQRRGRAGRQGPGVCYRLWTESEHSQLPEYPTPEIRVSDLGPLALDLARWGAPTGENLAFLDPPPVAHLAQAQDLLFRLGAMDDKKILTPHGRAMTDLSVHPRFAHMILKAKEWGLAATACELAAVLEERDLLAKSDADLTLRLDALQRRQNPPLADRILTQKRRLLEMIQGDNDRTDISACGLLTALAYPERVARKKIERPGSYLLANGVQAILPEESLLARHEFLAVADVDSAAVNARIYLAAPINRQELEKAFAESLLAEQEVLWDSRQNRVIARRIRRIGVMIVDQFAMEPEGEQVSQAMLEGVRRIGLQGLPWNEEADRFRRRVQWLRRIVPELPDFSGESLEKTLDTWLAPYLIGMWRQEQLQQLRLVDILRQQLSREQIRELERLAPAHIPVPSGSRIALDYTTDEHPILAVKLQELFGLIETPRVANGRIPVTIHLLSPAARPLAVTQDLHSFWQNTYPEIRKQLRSRYPKHPWPEDPFTAEPTRKTVRKKITSR